MHRFEEFLTSWVSKVQNVIENVLLLYKTMQSVAMQSQFLYILQ